jgi:long-chain acyl-CoA synthetase
MVITQVLDQNHALYADQISLVEVNPQAREEDAEGWKEYALVETGREDRYRRQMTWAQFDEKANRFGHRLLQDGFTKGSKVAILLMNCLEWLPIYFGILKTGAIVVPMNFRYSSEEIEYCLSLAQCDAIVFGPEFVERMAAIAETVAPQVKKMYYVGDDCPAFAQSYEALTANCSADALPLVVTPQDDAAIYFSSGTTGFPKAILHSHEALMSACYTENAHHGQTHDDVFLCIPPLYHTGAKMHWFGSFLVGGKAVLLRGTKPEWILQAASQEQATIVWLLVPWAQDILDAIDSGRIKLSDYKLDQWRLMHIGAQPVPQSLIARWHKHFPNQQYDTNYGLSESIGPGCVHLGVENIHKVGAIGVPGHNWQAQIVDENGQPVAQGQVGELIVKGPGVMKCYYRDPAATAAAKKGDWLYTGDMAMQDADGFIYLVDRKKDVIITGGENIYPVQIEDFLRSDEAIKDVAVIGLPDKRLGEIAAAIIEVRDGFTCTEEDIREFCKALPRYKRPRKIIFDRVPRNPTGKIEKPKLRKKFHADAIVAQQTK